MNPFMIPGTKRYHAPLDGGAGGQTRNPIADNMMARQFMIRNSQNMWQQIYTETIAGANTATIGAVRNIQLRGVGFGKRLLIRIAATVQANGQTLTLAPMGITQFLSNVILTDLSNQQRINTPGWHLYNIATAKRRLLYGAAYTTDTPSGWGSNFPAVMAAPTTITTNPTTNNVFMDYDVPITYTDMDTRGGIYLNVTNANAYLQFQINPNFFVTSTADKTFAVYQSASGTLGLLTSVTITVYQNYLDQIPLAQNGGPVLPLLDMSTAYQLTNTPVNANVGNQDIPIPFANFRDFLSAFAVFNNGGVLNTGSDINYWELQSANFTAIFKYDPQIAALLTRNIIGDDPPAGVYYFEFREKPVSTINYGNMQLVLNAINPASNAYLQMGYEMMALINQVTNAGSLYGTG